LSCCSNYYSSARTTKNTISPTAINANTDGVETTLTSIDGKTPALGQALAAASVPVVLTAAQISTLTPQTNALTDTQLRATPVPVSGTVSTGGLTDAELRASPVAVSGPLTDTELRATAVPVSLTSTTITGTVAATQSGTWNITNVSVAVSLPTGASTETTLSAINGKLNSLGQKTMANSAPVVLASDQASIPVTGTFTSAVVTAATATLSNVSGSASSVSVLASNASRKGATFYNDSTASLYLKFGTTASTSSFTVLMQPGAYYELPTTAVYTGALDGIWSAANGAVRVTELS